MLIRAENVVKTAYIILLLESAIYTKAEPVRRMYAVSGGADNAVG